MTRDCLRTVQFTQRTFVTVPNTFADFPAFAVATTVVPFRACRYPVERASAIDRTVNAVVAKVPQVVQLSLLPLRLAPENAHTLPVPQVPTAKGASASEDVISSPRSGHDA